MTMVTTNDGERLDRPARPPRPGASAADRPRDGGPPPQGGELERDDDALRFLDWIERDPWGSDDGPVDTIDG